MTVTVWSYHGHNVCRSDFPGCKDRIASFDVLTGKLRPLYLRNYLADFFCIGLNMQVGFAVIGLSQQSVAELSKVSPKLTAVLFA